MKYSLEVYKEYLKIMLDELRSNALTPLPPINELARLTLEGIAQKRVLFGIYSQAHNILNFALTLVGYEQICVIVSREDIPLEYKIAPYAVKAELVYVLSQIVDWLKSDYRPDDKNFTRALVVMAKYVDFIPPGEKISPRQLEFLAAWSAGETSVVWENFVKEALKKVIFIDNRS